MEHNRIWVVPDVHCRNFYKPILDIKDEPVIFLGDYMDPYYWEGNSDKQGIANLKEILDYAKNNKNVTLLCGNHDCSWIWSQLFWERTPQKYYKELHQLYRDNIKLFSVAKQIEDTIFTHAGISNAWINAMNNVVLKNNDFKLNQGNIVDYINNEFYLELESDETPNQHFMSCSLDSEIFCVGRSRGGYAPSGGPVWCDFNDDFNPVEGWNVFQIFSHTQGELTGVVRKNISGACVDSRAIFEYYLESHLIVPSEINNEQTKKEIPDFAWKGEQLCTTEEYERSVQEYIRNYSNENSQEQEEI